MPPVTDPCSVYGKVFTAIDGRLKERYRIAIELRLIQELPREDCAKRLGVTIGTFDVLLFRAVRAFRKQFGERAPTIGDT